MRQATGTTTLFQIVIGFTLLFAAFLSVAITYNRVFRLKNETLGIIERYEGISDKSLGIINNYLKNSGYTTKRNCEKDEFGVDNLDRNVYEKVDNENKKYYYCLSDYTQTNANGDQIFYKIKLFFNFNLPFIGDLVTFKITGETKGIKLWDINEQGLKEQII